MKNTPFGTGRVNVKTKFLSSITLFEIIIAVFVSASYWIHSVPFPNFEIQQLTWINKKSSTAWSPTRPKSPIQRTPSRTCLIIWWNSHCITFGVRFTLLKTAIPRQIISRNVRSVYHIWREKWWRTNRKSISCIMGKNRAFPDEQNVVEQYSKMQQLCNNKRLIC